MYALFVFSLGVMFYATDILVVKDARFNLTAVRSQPGETDKLFYYLVTHLLAEFQHLSLRHRDPVAPLADHRHQDLH